MNDQKYEGSKDLIVLGDNIPVVRDERSPILRKDVDKEIEVSEQVQLSQSSASSLAGKIIKIAIYAALDWLSNRNTLRREGSLSTNDISALRQKSISRQNVNKNDMDGGILSRRNHRCRSSSARGCNVRGQRMRLQRKKRI